MNTDILTNDILELIISTSYSKEFSNIDMLQVKIYEYPLQELLAEDFTSSL